MQNRIFSTDSPKAVKAAGFGYLNAIHYMAPHSLSGYNLCPKATAGCKALCLGRWSGAAMYYDSVNKSRVAKAQRFMRDRQAYLRDIVKAIYAAERQASRAGLKLCVRLNGSTDIAWEGIRCDNSWLMMRGATIFDWFPHVQFVDYTKVAARLKRKLPANYHLTLSRSENNEAECMDALSNGHNVAVVFKRVPDMWKGFRVIDGDAHDLRHLDPRSDSKGVIVGLSPKGPKAKRDQSGFVVQ